MTVSELIKLLQVVDPNAVVLLGEERDSMISHYKLEGLEPRRFEIRETAFGSEVRSLTQNVRIDGQWQRGEDPIDGTVACVVLY